MQKINAVDNDSIVYKTNQATSEQIHKHLEQCDEQFFLQLSRRINILEYSKKIFEKALTIEAWTNSFLIGLVAIYFNTQTHSAFITNMSVSKHFLKQGIGSELMSRCIEYSRQKKMNEIKLEVNSENKKAIAFYKKFCFTEQQVESNLFLMKFNL